MTPIFIPMNYGSGNIDCTGMELVVALLVCFYLCQLIMVWMNLFMEFFEFKSKSDFLYWNIPFLPIIIVFIKKIASIKKD